MRILIVTARYYPETFSITNIAEQMVKMGHEITVLTGRPHYGVGKIYNGYENTKNETINGVTIVRVNERIRKKTNLSLMLNYISIFWQFKKGLRRMKGDFDIVISHVLSPIYSISGVKRFCDKNHIPHLHYGLDLWPESLIATGYAKKDGLFYKIVKKQCIKIYKGCDCIVFASPSVEDYFKKYLKINIPFKQIYQPCLSTQPSYEIVKKHLFCNDGKIHFLFCGTIAIFNHLELFISALNNNSIKNKVIFDVVGSGSQMDRMVSLTKKLKLENIVKFYGRMSSNEAIQFYLKSDVLFAPLYNNSATSKMIPQKVIEYLMYGKPILGMLTGDGASLIMNASSGNIICDQTVESLRSAIMLLCNYSIEKMKRTGKDNYNYFLNNKRFKIENVCQELIEISNSLIKKNYNKCTIKSK